MVHSLSVTTTAVCCAPMLSPREGREEWFVAWDEGRGAAVPYNPTEHRYEKPPVSLALSGTYTIAGS